VEIDTERLRLRRLTPADIDALLEGVPLDGCPWAPGYPQDGTLVAAAMQIRLQEMGEASERFAQFQIIRRDDSVVIGDIGFHTPPDDMGDVSIGFGVVPSARGDGYATEALRAMLAWALEQPEVRTVHADTDLVNLASQHVLTAAGMQLVEDDGDRKVYEVVSDSAASPSR
jgi:RimJ/RimL family protein N-acetyltransferase